MHNGTMKMRHPKRGGWKGAKQSKRNHDAHRTWMENKKVNRPVQVWSEISEMWIHV